MTKNQMQQQEINLSETEWIRNAQNGNTLAIEHVLSEYDYLILSLGNRLFLSDQEKDDLFQEGRIGLFFAIRDYQQEKQIPFSAFARICVFRKMVDAIRATRAKKRLKEHSEIPLQDVIQLESKGIVLWNDNRWQYDPEKYVLLHELQEELSVYVRHAMSSMEKMVMVYILLGYSYRETGERLQRNSKCVDNALQRIFRKLDRFHRNRI